MGQVHISAEDGFALITPGLQGGAIPTADEARNLAQVVGQLAGQTASAQWQPVWDLRSVRGYGDRRFYAACATLGMLMQGVGLPTDSQRVLVRPDSDDLAWHMGWAETSLSRQKTPPTVIAMKPKSLPRRTLDLRLFDDGDLLDPYEIFDDASTDASDYVNAAIELGLATKEDLGGQVFEWIGDSELESPAGSSVPRSPDVPTMAEGVWATAVEQKRTRLIDEALSSLESNSLLVQIAMTADSTGSIHIIPYHSYSLHEVSAARDELVLMRPGRISGSFWSRFRSDIVKLERLLNEPNVQERHIEELLLSNPLFMRGLNYREVYPQVILPRQGAPDFRPDVIAEPIGDRWAHIIDFKLPDKKVLVGTESRLRLSAAITEAAAQLREYRAYFDDRALAKRIEDQLGISCYQPKMVVIIGRDPTEFSPEQRRRAMTSDPTLEIVTYDQLIRAARDQGRLLL
jgi:hypothetical protein